MNTVVTSQTLMNMWHNYNTDGLFHMCKQLIVDHLLLNGVEFIKNGKKYDVGHEFRDTFETYWTTFTKDAVDQLIAFGFVAVEIVKDDTKRKYPRTVHPYFLNVEFDYETRKYTVRDRDVRIYGGFGFDPIRGRLTSLAAKVMPKLKYLARLRESCAYMEDRKVDPMYFAEVHEEAKEAIRGVQYDFYADDGDPRRERADNARFNRNEHEVSVLKHQQELYDEQFDNVRASRGLKNVIQLPHGQKLVKTSDYTGRADIVQIHKVTQEEICSTLGVPRSLLIGDSMYRSDTEGVQELFRQTIMWWQSKMEMIETDLYQTIYFDSNKVKLSKNIYAAKQRYQIKIHFPLSPFASTEELTYLYKAGVISWERYSTGVLRNASLPVEILPEPEEPLEEQPVRKRQRVAKSKLAM